MPTTASSNKSPVSANLLAKIQTGESLENANYNDLDLYAIALNQANLAKINFSQSLNVWNLAWSYMWHKGFSVGNGGIIVVLLFLELKRFDGIILEVE